MSDDPKLELVEEPENGRFVELDTDLTQEQVADNLRKSFAISTKRRQAKRRARIDGEVSAELAEAKQMNRAGALRFGSDGEVKFYWAACACKWHSLRADDPEKALREYDAHPCAIGLYDNSAVDRELRIVEGRLEKRAASLLARNEVMPDGAIYNSMNPRPVDDAAKTGAKQMTQDEEQELRFSLLELKR